MIVEWLVSVGTAIADSVVGLFPTLNIPDTIQHLDQSVNGLFNSINGLGVWLDLPTVAIMAGIPTTVFVAGLAFKGGRLLISHLPFIGGK